MKTSKTIIKRDGYIARIVPFMKKNCRLKISVNQIQNYVEYLANAFLIHRVGRYDLVGKCIDSKFAYRVDAHFSSAPLCDRVVQSMAMTKVESKKK